MDVTRRSNNAVADILFLSTRYLQSIHSGEESSKFSAITRARRSEYFNCIMSSAARHWSHVGGEHIDCLVAVVVLSSTNRRSAITEWLNCQLPDASTA